MNDLCCGAPNGLCTRHQMKKCENLVPLCNGTSSSNCTSLYWNAWERGKAGAGAPQADPQYDPPGFCKPGQGGAMVPCAGCGSGLQRPGLVTMAATAATAYARFVGDGLKTTSEAGQQQRQELCAGCPLNDEGQCVGCGCYLLAKIPMRLEGCPAGKWFPELHAARPLIRPVRNLVYSVLPVARNENWRWNLDQVATRANWFNGKRVLAISIDEAGPVKTVTAEEVLNYSRSIGLEWDTVQAFRNNSALREVTSFPWLLEQVESLNPHEITFAAHAKSVTHAADSITVKWAERQYRACLDDVFSVERALANFSIAGAFRKFGEFTTPGNNRWHYSGTFYWFRNDDVFSRDWRTIDQTFFGTESWPGRMFKPEESACLFGDDAGDLYQAETWHGLERAVQVWEEARRR